MVFRREKCVSSQFLKESWNIVVYLEQIMC